ncbi:MAG: nucleotide exchange factor GrpE [Anaerolineae bacterium]|nr:nucleotide exchange factor GrpE [Anaerolineae bacterium]
MSNDKQVMEEKAATASTEQAENSQTEQESDKEKPQAVTDLGAQLAEVQAQAAEYLDGWQRARADLENYRKRITRERKEWEAMIKGEIILNLLPALDDFDLALENLPEDVAEHDWVGGIVLVHRKLHGQLEAMDLSEIEAMGQTFDPELHEAVTHEKSDSHQPNEIIGVMRKGYRLGDKVIRAAMVRVAS